MSAKTAVILLNLGGPPDQDAVRPFLFNLFNDKAILGAPQPVRALAAALIAATRAKSARANYALMGGGSPIQRETEAQAQALQHALPEGFKTFIAMRHWSPFAEEAARAAKAWGATQAVLAPLYPQFSTTTTGSAFTAWATAWAKAGGGPTHALCCYPGDGGLARAHAEAILAAWGAAGAPDRPRVLFSAHGLPQRTIDRGDPYQWQIERTAAAIAALLPEAWETRICYQSRVGPLKWLQPSTPQEIAAAGRDGVGVIVAPIAFVSEHVETLVELDIEYAHLAETSALPFYLRARTPGVSPDFIAALAARIVAAANAGDGLSAETLGRLCPAAFGLCPKRAAS